MDERDLDAGDFSSWLAETTAAIRGDRDAEVPCGGCTACCTSSQFVHIGPDEADTLAHIPPELLFPAPFMPEGHVVLGYDERGHCPMLIDNQCSIYDHRPRTCRTYDCRIFPATGIKIFDRDKAAIETQAGRWRFDLPAAADKVERDEVRAAVTFIEQHRNELPDGIAPANETQLAVLAIEVHALRSELVAAGVVFPDEELALILQASNGSTEAAELVRRRAQGEPLNYVTGLVEFRSLKLAIGPGAFIPRPGTAVVVDRAGAALPPAGLVVDICTGNGAIALSIASERPDATVYGIDISPEALAWAAENRNRTGLDVTLLHGDLFDPLPIDLRGRIDVVVANPPHVPVDQEHFMPRDVVDHEPAEALFAGPDGLLLIIRLATEGLDWLKPGGWFVCEIGDSQIDEVSRRVRDLGYTDVSVHSDESERRRVIEGRKS